MAVKLSLNKKLNAVEKRIFSAVSHPEDNAYNLVAAIYIQGIRDVYSWGKRISTLRKKLDKLKNISSTVDNEKKIKVSVELSDYLYARNKAIDYLLNENNKHLLWIGVEPTYAISLLKKSGLSLEKEFS